MATIFSRLATTSVALFGAWYAVQAQAQQVVGAVSAANASPTGRAPGQGTRTLKLGADIFFKDHIVTKRNGGAQLTFLDRSTLNVSENSDLVIDEFVYNPGADGKMSATLKKGVLRFVGGDISHGGGTVVKTPTVTIGIRGGIGTIAYVTDASALASMPGVPSDFQGGTIIVNGYGTMSVRNGANEVEISRPGFAVFVGSVSATIAAPQRFDMSAAQAMMKSLASKAGQHGGASKKTAVALATRGTAGLVNVPVAIPTPHSIDALSFTGVFAAGNSLARNQSQAHQAAALQMQLLNIARMQVVASTPPASTPPASTPPASTPPASTPPASTPPAGTPPASTPPASTPPASTPPAGTPPAGMPPAGTPPAGTPPAGTPPASTPPAGTPPAGTPPASTPPASTPPAGTPPAGTPPASTPPASTPPVGELDTHDINANVVTADVIYAHSIDAGSIQGVVHVGGGYGNGSGSDLSSTNVNAVTIDAHDIHASVVIANQIYVQSINGQ